MVVCGKEPRGPPGRSGSSSVARLATRRGLPHIRPGEVAYMAHGQANELDLVAQTTLPGRLEIRRVQAAGAEQRAATREVRAAQAPHGGSVPDALEIVLAHVAEGVVGRMAAGVEHARVVDRHVAHEVPAHLGAVGEVVDLLAQRLDLDGGQLEVRKVQVDVPGAGHGTQLVETRVEARTRVGAAMKG